MPNFTSMPEFTNYPRSLEHSTSEDTLTSLGRYLRPSSNPAPLEKMLTPVEERPSAEYDREHSSLSDDGDQDIVPSSSDKLDGSIFSRSISGLSDPPTWRVGDREEGERNGTRDSTSILSSGYGTPPRSILNSTNSMDISEINQVQETLENHEEKASSQGSDDSSTFSESAPTTHFARGGANYHQVVSPQGSGSFSFSSAEGTPVRTMSETRKKHPAKQGDTKKVLVSSFSDSTTHGRRSRPLSSPQSSANSSVSRLTLSSQSSAGEDAANSDTSDRRSRYQKKYRNYEKYERYESRERSMSLDTSPRFTRKSLESRGDSELANESTQDSNGTLTDGNLDNSVEALTEVELSSSHSVASVDSFYQNGKASEGGREKKRSMSLEPEQVLSNAKGIDRGEKDASGIVRDSGFGDTNYKSGEPGESSTPNDNADSKVVSYKLVFDSRDSMLTDSPDTDSLNDDGATSKGVTAPTQPPRKQASLQSKSSMDRHSRATSEGSEASIGSPAHVELIIEDGKPARLYESSTTSPISMNIDITQDDDEVDSELMRESDDEDSVHDLERSGSASNAPRSLEGPSFSRFARVPVRNTESKTHVRPTENPLYDGGSGLRQKACSLNDLDEVSSSQEDPEDTKNKRATSESRHDDPYLIPVPSTSSMKTAPEGLPQSSSAMDLQSSGDADLEPIRDKAFGGVCDWKRNPRKEKDWSARLSVSSKSHPVPLVKVRDRMEKGRKAKRDDQTLGVERTLPPLPSTSHLILRRGRTRKSEE